MNWPYNSALRNSRAILVFYKILVMVIVLVLMIIKDNFLKYNFKFIILILKLELTQRGTFLPAWPQILSNSPVHSGQGDPYNVPCSLYHRRSIA